MYIFEVSNTLRSHYIHESGPYFALAVKTNYHTTLFAKWQFYAHQGLPGNYEWPTWAEFQLACRPKWQNKSAKPDFARSY